MSTTGQKSVLATTACYSSFAILALMLTWFAVTAPAQVPGHFDASGVVSRWDSKGAFLLSMSLIGGGLLALLGTFHLWIPRLPPQMINIPRRDFWTRPENRAAFSLFIHKTFSQIMLLIALLFSALLVVTEYAAQLLGQIPDWFFPLTLSCFFLLLAAILIPFVIESVRTPRRVEAKGELSR